MSNEYSDVSMEEANGNIRSLSKGWNIQKVVLAVTMVLTLLVSVVCISIGVKIAESSMLQSFPLFHEGNNLDTTDCLDMDAIEDAISNADMTFILMAPKSGGTSMKDFTAHCLDDTLELGSKHQDNLNYAPLDSSKSFARNMLKSYVQSKEEPPKIMASHVYDDEAIIRISNSVDPKSLIIYVYRNELERLKSSINYVAAIRMCRFSDVFTQDFPEDVTSDSFIQHEDNTCTINEDLMLTVIENKYQEIGIGQNQILTCDLYDSVKKNDPNMLYIHYTQLDLLQDILAKYHCPELIGSSFHDNKKDQRPLPQHIYSSETQTTLPVEEWTNNKASLLAWSLNLLGGEKEQCNRETHQIEHKLDSCPIQMIRATTVD